MTQQRALQVAHVACTMAGLAAGAVAGGGNVLRGLPWCAFAFLLTFAGFMRVIEWAFPSPLLGSRVRNRTSGTIGVVARHMVGRRVMVHVHVPGAVSQWDMSEEVFRELWEPEVPQP